MTIRKVWFSLVLIFGTSFVAFAQPRTRPQEMIEVNRFVLKNILHPPPDICSSITFDISPDGNTIVVSFVSLENEAVSGKNDRHSGDHEYYIALIDRQTKNVLATKKLEDPEPSITFRRNGRELISVQDREITVRNAKTLEVVRSIGSGVTVDEARHQLRAQAYSLAASRDLLAVHSGTFSAERGVQLSPPNFGYHDLPLVVYDLEQGRIRDQCRLFPVDAFIRRPIAISLDGRLIAYGRSEPARGHPNLTVIEANSCKELRSWSFNVSVGEIGFSPDTNYIVATLGFGKTKAVLLRLSDGLKVLEIPHESSHPGPGWSFSISKSGRWLAIDSTLYKISFWEAFSGIGHVEQMGIDLWDLRNGRVAARVRIPKSKTRAIPGGWGSGLRFAADDRFILNQPFDGTIRVYRVPDTP